MAVWEDFEIECTDYLQKAFGSYASFKRLGGSDSTVPDILAETDKGNFYIDAKHSPAQCGQFVLLPNIEKRQFDYSSQNVNHINTYAQRIMEHMNREFDEYRDAGTAGKDISFSGDQNVFSGWIIDTYKSKGAQFFITNEKTILPIDRFKDYFDITAKYRIKRSGSSSVGKSRINSVLNYIKTNGYLNQSHRKDDDKLFVTSPESYHNKRFILRGYEYMFSLRDSEYEIRKLSNTYNANVIFSIKLKEGAPGLSSEEFISSLTS